MASTANLLAYAEEYALRDRLKIGFLVLQKYNSKEQNYLSELIDRHKEDIKPYIFDVANSYIEPCLACRYCPTRFGDDQEYRCAIRNESDFFVQNHKELVSMDAIVPVVFSPQDKRMISSQYQTFIERTRYLRRSDYIFSNVPFMPLIFEEMNANQNFHMRLITSFIRHETVALRPTVALLHQEKIINEDYVQNNFSGFIEKAKKITIGRLVAATQNNCSSIYNPVGYSLKYSREANEKIKQQRQDNMQKRCAELQQCMSDRIIEIKQLV